MTKEQKIAFIKDLTELSRKHQIGVTGCSCCDSPYLVDLEEPPVYALQIRKPHDTGLKLLDEWDREHPLDPDYWEPVNA